MNVDRAAMGMAAMFPKVDALPGAESEATVLEGNGKVHAGQGAANVCGHIVGAFSSVDEKAIAVGNDARHPGFEIATDIWVGIFLDEERGRSVAHVQGAQAVV